MGEVLFVCTSRSDMMLGTFTSSAESTALFTTMNWCLQEMPPAPQPTHSVPLLLAAAV